MIKNYFKKILSIAVVFTVVFMSFATSLVFVQAVEPEEIGRALEYKIEFSSTIPENTPATIYDVRSMNGYNAFSNIIVNNGDKIHYELYIPSTSNYFYGLGGIDGSTNVNWVLLRNSNPKDQNDNYLYGDEKELYGSDKWISRDITLSGLPANEGLAHIGPSFLSTKDSIASLAGQTAIVYYRNIKVIHADNSESNIYVNGGFVSHDEMQNNIKGVAGTVSLSEVIPVVPPEEIGRALEYKVEFNSTLPTNPSTYIDVRSMNGYNAFSNIKVNNGDKLHYELYIPSTSNYFFGLGAMDGSTNATWVALRNSTPKDQNDNFLYSDQKALYGADKWITRDITLSGLPLNEGLAHIGPSFITPKALVTSLAGQTAIVYYRNIKVIHADNSQSNIYVNGGFVSHGYMENNISGVAATVSLTEIVPPEVIGKALEYKVDFNSTIPTEAPAMLLDSRSMNNYSAFSNIKVNNGDKLHYELYIPSTSNYFFGLGSMDGMTNANWAWLRGSNPKDQNNNDLYCDEKALYGTNKWITRDITLAGLPLNEGLAHIGPSFITPKASISTLAGQTAIVYFRNIKVIHADNSESDIYVDGGYVSTGFIENNLDGVATVSLTEVNNNSQPAVYFKGLKLSKDINNYVTNITPNTMISTFRTNVMTGVETTVSFKDKQGNLITEESINVGTGTTVVINNGIKSITYTAIIYGDLSKDGKVDLDDLVSIRNYLIESDPLDELSQKAGNLYGEGDITLNSLVGIMAYVSEAGTISQTR